MFSDLREATEAPHSQQHEGEGSPPIRRSFVSPGELQLLQDSDKLSAGEDNGYEGGNAVQSSLAVFTTLVNYTNLC